MQHVALGGQARDTVPHPCQAAYRSPRANDGRDPQVYPSHQGRQLGQ